MTTIAGDGTSGFGGDGGPATAAQLRVPLDVAVDSTGNVYIADAANARIRKVDTSGMISTIAGDGGSGFGGDGGPAIAAQLGNPAGVALDNLGNVYVADSATDRIRKIDTAGTISRRTPRHPPRRSVGQRREPLHSRYPHRPGSQG